MLSAAHVTNGIMSRSPFCVRVSARCQAEHVSVTTVDVANSSCGLTFATFLPRTCTLDLALSLSLSAGKPPAYGKRHKQTNTAARAPPLFFARSNPAPRLMSLPLPLPSFQLTLLPLFVIFPLFWRVFRSRVSLSALARRGVCFLAPSGGVRAKK